MKIFLIFLTIIGVVLLMKTPSNTKEKLTKLCNKYKDSHAYQDCLKNTEKIIDTYSLSSK